MSPTGSDSVDALRVNGLTGDPSRNFTRSLAKDARAMRLHAKFGFLLIGDQVFAYRYRESTEQLTITNPDGGAVCQPLSGDAAREALATIQKLANA